MSVFPGALFLCLLPLLASGAEPLSSEFLFGHQYLRQAMPMPDFRKFNGETPASGQHTGRTELSAAAFRGFSVHVDRFNYTKSGGRTIRTFPAITLDWAQAGGMLIPIHQGVLRTANPSWEIAFQVGRVWQTSSNPGLQRFVLPFALVETNANCTHNGVITWYVDVDGKTSRAAFEIASETCAYFKFDAWGVLPAVTRPAEIAVSQAIIAVNQQNQVSRLPVAPIDTIGDKYPQVDATGFGAVGDMHRDDLSVYGFVVDGVHYRSECQTRMGPYPFCDELLLPSYSTAKSLFASLGLMRLQALIPGAAERKIRDLIPECSDASWGDVTIENALDMATGHYNSLVPDADEGSAKHVEFLYAKTHSEKIRFACDFFPRQAAPGTQWVYHSSDTYLVGAAMRSLLEAERGSPVDIYLELIVRPIWLPLHLSAPIMATRHTYDAKNEPLTGWGLSYQSDDIARIAVWLLDGAPLADYTGLDPHLLAGAMQQNSEDPGLTAGDPAFRYNNGFWAHDIASYIGCSHPVWVPFMSGYGGISVVLFPNRTVYYYFSDGYTQRWREAAIESNKIRSLCE